MQQKDEEVSKYVDWVHQQTTEELDRTIALMKKLVAVMNHKDEESEASLREVLLRKIVEFGLTEDDVRYIFRASPDAEQVLNHPAVCWSC